MDEKKREEFKHSLRRRMQDKNHEEIADAIVWAIDNYYQNDGDPECDPEPEPVTAMAPNPSRQDLEKFQQQIDKKFEKSMQQINKSMDDKFTAVLEMLKQQNKTSEDLANLKKK